jgi:hypothetical protein
VVTAAPDFTRWLEDAAVSEATLTAAQRAVLHAAFDFLRRCGRDYYSVRLLSHFLLHCQAGLQVTQVARLLRLSRSAASAQQGLSSQEVIRAAHHRFAGRSHGKLLPRFAGPIAQFLHQHPDATRWDLLDFIHRTWGVSISRMALHRFFKKYGLDGGSVVLSKPGNPTPTEPAPEPPVAQTTGPFCRTGNPTPTEPAPEPPPTTAQANAAADAAGTEAVVVAADVPPPADEPLPLPPAEFFLPRPATPAPFCSCPPR